MLNLYRFILPIWIHICQRKMFFIEIIRSIKELKGGLPGMVGGLLIRMGSGSANTGVCVWVINQPPWGGDGGINPKLGLIVKHIFWEEH